MIDFSLGYNWILNLFDQSAPPVTLVKKARKKNDTTKFTQYHYDFIRYAYADFTQFNLLHPKSKKTTQDLTDVINAKMGTDKSRTALSRIWLGKVDRSTLAVGTNYFTY